MQNVISVRTNMASRLGNILRRTFSAQGPSATSGDHGEGVKLWRNLTFFVALPGVALCWANAYVFSEHDHERHEFKPYSHLYIRSKPFPWGDGNHGLFHNKAVNALPEGYEE
ncbi:cytochrome c oxidase subunit 6A2, mitochondrial [Octopus bimaculoides]|uniref:Cytochrome c oxidase polypeptide VIa n=1 Tax=Octopus bimaculoides TaxID=37653 RepID=A0A0L8FRW5_OCTBM|nr:cytochrome c oxidase subunit 6A2, mitochondrial [Octopus bimaculoides]|eukprot:XP_014787526.1 PREDICTED: cytochrome c oxidase subunit 6A2, mitochondrial-like [Octopus bimaculoides]